MALSLPPDLIQAYGLLKNDIRNKLTEYANVPEEKWFYELCYCLCTPQSKAVHALQVQNKLESKSFILSPFNPVDILSDKNHYIRFHNTKSKNITLASEKFHEISSLIKSPIPNFEKRIWLKNNILGLGLKEASHFLRNIGFRGLAILDRHILKHLTMCGLFDILPKPVSDNKYYHIESEFLKFADFVNIPIDELDLLFWSYETGIILK